MDIPSTIIIIILFLAAIIIAYKIGTKIGTYQQNKLWETQLPSERKDAINRSRAVLGGQFSEQLAPFLPNFPYNPSDCKFLGKPIDLIVFKGMDNKEIEEVKFIEIKSGNSQLSPSERKLKEAIENKRVSWEEYRIPRELTDKKDYS
jgi:predicted Holliday junction resolvase-like endonuclease